MLNIKLVTQFILCSTIFSVILLLSMKYLEIQKDYPRKHFCVTCPCLPDPSLPRNVEIEVNFNLLIIMDFLSLMMIILLFGIEKYYEHPTYLFAFHVCRFIFNTTNFTTSGIIDKVLNPMFNELCGFGGHCSDEKVLPHTTVALLYLIYFSVMVTNFSITIILMYFYDPYYQTRRSPVIVSLRNNVRRPRPVFRLDLTSPFNTAPYSSYNRSPSPPKLMRVVIPPTKLTKYHRLDSCDSFSFRHQKNKVMPLSLPVYQPQVLA